MAKGKIEVDKEICKGCGLCARFCPQNCIELSPHVSKMAFHYAVQVRPEKCVACKMCAYVCGEAAIEVYKEV